MADNQSSIREQNFEDRRTNQRKTDKKNARHRNVALDIFVYGTLILATVVTSVCIFWELYPYHIITVTNVKMTSLVVHQGDVTTYENDYVKTMDMEAAARRTFVDGLVFDAGNYTANLPTGSGHVVRELPIPETLPPGKYHVVITLRYHVNPIRDIEVTFKTNEFTVLAMTTDAKGPKGDPGVTGLQRPKGDPGAPGLGY